jgi:(p)ppGpp synthase/HD superfamily hydrolase
MNEGIRLVARAAEFAARAHCRHRRKDVDQTPYINHLAHVAYLLAEAGCDAELVAAGYLHDTIEDVEVSYETLYAEFGADVADLVMAVTDDKTQRWQQQKQAQIDHAASATARTAALKLADKISNLYSLRDTPPHGWDEEEIRMYIDWAHEVVRRLRAPNAVLLAEYERIRGELLGRIGGSQ